MTECSQVVCNSAIRIRSLGKVRCVLHVVMLTLLTLVVVERLFDACQPTDAWSVRVIFNIFNIMNKYV